MITELVADFEKRYPSGATVRGELCQPLGSFSVTVLFGPSGCGKTTLLRSLAGLERPESGSIRFGDETWFDADARIHRSPQERDVGLLFQDYALFPHLTVAENIGYGLRAANRDERATAVGEMLDRFQLAGLANRRPQYISGGEQQRVALARVLARRPRLLLLDEPLSALDAGLRQSLRGKLRRQLADFAIPVVVVTHDSTEAIALGDRLVVMQAGRVLEQGSVAEVFTRPRDLEVARIVGMETVLAGEIIHVKDGLAEVRVGKATLVAVPPEETCRTVHVCIKGEDVVLRRGASEDTSVRNQLAAVVEWLTPEGPLVRVGLRSGFKLSALVTRPASEELGLQVGEQVTACIKATAIHLIAASD